MTFAFYCMLFGILTFSPETDAGELTWKEPLPIQTVPDNNRTDHFGKKVLREGNTNATIRWHFALTGLDFDSLAISFEGQVIAGVRSSAQGPQPGFENQFGINWIASQNLVTLFIFNVTTEVNGVFKCVVSAARGSGTFLFSSNVQVNVVAPPSRIVTFGGQTLIAPAQLTLNCSADGKPKPTLTWTRVSDNTVVTMPLNITGGKDAGSYRCTADNGVGNPQHKDIKVNVLFSPKVTLANKFFVGREQTASLICQVEGNPKPTISWSRCDPPNLRCDKQYLNISKVQTARANYTCTARNYLGSDSATTVLLIGGNNVNVRLSVNSKCKDKDSVWETLENELRRVFGNTSYISAQRIGVSCGSLIFDVVLEFSIKVAEDDTISTIQTAVRDGKLGQLSVNASYVIGRLPVVRSTSTLTPATSTSPKSDGTTSAPSISEPTSAEQEGTASAPSISEPTSAEQEAPAGPLWAIIGGATGGVAVLAIVVGVLAWWVHKQRKCGNDTEIHSSGQERHGAYAQSGPPAANGTEGAAEQEIEVAAAIPTYAVVNKPKKKKVREEVPPVYAEVDKSKKKKKKIDDKNLYEILDEPKKEKKPGELLYADLGDFKNPGMPTVSTSSQPLPAIKKADPYERTDYADITQFLKGNATFPPSDGNGDTEMKPEHPSKKKIQGKDKETPI